MDEVAALLDGPRAQRAFLLRMRLAAPWAMRIADHAPLSVVAVTTGGLWLVPDEGAPQQLHEGDLALVRGPGEYVIADESDRAPQVLIDERQDCVSLDGVDRPLWDWCGVRTWGADTAAADTTVLSGTYTGDGELGRPMLAALPPIAVIRGSHETAALIALLAAGLDSEAPGQTVVLDRSLDLLLITAVRRWLLDAADRPGWFTASADPIVGPALDLLQHDPSAPWTVESLARRVGASRAAFARRFSSTVGETPMRYLAAWRLRLAADLLRDGSRTIASVADQVGYGSAFALSTAFSREFGQSPSEYRRSRVA